jgi:hypothetical protein
MNSLYFTEVFFNFIAMTFFAISWGFFMNLSFNYSLCKKSAGIIHFKKYPIDLVEQNSPTEFSNKT